MVNVQCNLRLAHEVLHQLELHVACDHLFLLVAAFRCTHDGYEAARRALKIYMGDLADRDGTLLGQESSHPKGIRTRHTNKES